MITVGSEILPACRQCGNEMLHPSLNPISGRLLATPISGKGGCLGPSLEIFGSYRSIFKIQTAFVSPQHDLHF